MYHEDMERRPITFGERIAARIDRQETGCWSWSGTYAADGYPVFTSPSGNISIIPALWVQEYGAVPDGMVLTCTHHRTGGGTCVNPAHYFPRPAGGVLPDQCRWGHDLTDPLNVWWSGKRRFCVACMARRGVRKGPTTSRRRTT